MDNKEAIEYLNDVRNGIHIPAPGIELPLLNDKEKEAVDIAIAALEQQEQDRWIPVVESLPEEDGNYLVTYEKGFAEDYGLDPIGIAPFEVDCEKFGIWVERFDKMTLGSLGRDWTEIKVVAWQPLPERFIGDKDGSK